MYIKNKYSNKTKHVFLTYPIQAAQILHQMFICRGIVIDYSMLFIHTTRLKWIFLS